MKLILPVPPNRANDSRVWQFRAFEKQKYYKTCESYLFGKRPKTPWNRITWTAHIQVARLNDADNLVARCKWVLDSLVMFKFLVDDGPKHCWPKAFPTQEVVRDKIKLITLEIDVHE